jgi:hypothetical protein
LAFLLKKHTENYTCLSTDVKTVIGVQAGSKCEELDTGKQYIFDGASWRLDLISAKLTAGTGEVGIDQTADGTTNRVVAKISEIAGENSVLVNGKVIVASGKKTDADTTDRTISTTGFNHVAIINDGPAELVLAIDESALTGTKRIYVGDSEGFEDDIVGTVLHYTIANESCVFRYVLM